MLAVATAVVALGVSTAFLGGTGKAPAAPVGDSIVGQTSPLAGKLIVNADAPATGTTSVRYTGSTAECDFLHKKYPDGVPETDCLNVATFTSTGTARTVQLCSAYSCDAWHAAVDFGLRYDGATVSATGGTCRYGGLAYDALKDWSSHTGDGTGTVAVAADFYVIINGIPITVEWHVRTVNNADGSWHIDVYHT
jgi:hypothetical protein